MANKGAAIIGLRDSEKVHNRIRNAGLGEPSLRNLDTAGLVYHIALDTCINAIWRKFHKYLNWACSSSPALQPLHPASWPRLALLKTKMLDMFCIKRPQSKLGLGKETLKFLKPAPAALIPTLRRPTRNQATPSLSGVIPKGRFSKVTETRRFGFGACFTYPRSRTSNLSGGMKPNLKKGKPGCFCLQASPSRFAGPWLSERPLDETLERVDSATGGTTTPDTTKPAALAPSLGRSVAPSF